MATLIPDSLSDLNWMRDVLSPQSAFPDDMRNLLIRLINGATRHFLTISGLGSLKYRSLTEYHDGMSSQWIVSNYFPIVSITSIHDDPSRQYNTGTLISSSGYEIYSNGFSPITPNSGLIRRLGTSTWLNGRSNVKLIYEAGFSAFVVQEGINDRIVINEGSSDIQISITEGEYNASSLATELQTQLNGGGGGLTYTVAYSSTSHRFKISTPSSFSMKWENLRESRFAELIGFDTVTTILSGSSAYYSDYPSLGVPEDIIEGISNIVRWKRSEIYEGRTGKTSDESESFNFDNYSSYMRNLIKPYEIPRVRGA